MAAEFAFKQLKVKRAATIHDGSIYAEQLQAVFAETFKKLGGTITSQEAVAPTDTDMRPVLTKIATGKPEFHLLSRLYCSRWPHHTPGEGSKGFGEGCSDGCGWYFLPRLL